MKAINVTLSILLLAPLCVPARADFKYTETSKITGGALKGAMKFAGVFSKQASQATQPIVTTHYVKGNRLRTDNPDGKIQIIDVEGRRIIDIDTQKRTYSEITFEQMKEAIQNAQQQAQKKMEQDPKAKDAKANVNVKFTVTPGTGTREIMGQTTNESKVRIEMEVQAQTQDGAQPAQPSGPVNGTIVTTMDMWVAPSVAGYQELGKFYGQMSKDLNWVPPSNIHVDPRASQSLEELQKNSANLKGFPLLQYMSMSMAGQQDSSGTAAQTSNPSASSSSSSNSDSTPTSLGGAMTKGLGGLFGKKKKQDDAADQSGQNPPPPSTPGSLIEMTIEVNSYSDTPLESSLFDVPAGYTRVTENPEQIIGGKPAKE
jgi:uncharacterized protein YbjQ (UPF0145 family)